MAGELAQLAAIKHGVSAGELFRIGVEATRAAGFFKFDRNHCGHGIGVIAHEYPSMNAAHNDVCIEAGMVLCVETPYYETGWRGMMVEDTVVVTVDGYEPLTVADRSLRVICKCSAAAFSWSGTAMRSLARNTVDTPPSALEKI